MRLLRFGSAVQSALKSTCRFIGRQCLQHIRLRNAELSCNSRRSDPSSERCASSIHLARVNETRAMLTCRRRGVLSVERAPLAITSDGCRDDGVDSPQSPTVVCVAVWSHRTQPHKARPVHRRSVGLQPNADSWARHDAAWRCQLPAVRQRWALLPMKKRLAPYRSRRDQALLAWRGHVPLRHDAAMSFGRQYGLTGKRTDQALSTDRNRYP